MWKYIVWSSHRYKKCVVVIVIEGFFGFPPLRTHLAELVDLQAKIVELESRCSADPVIPRSRWRAEQGLSKDTHSEQDALQLSSDDTAGPRE